MAFTKEFIDSLNEKIDMYSLASDYVTGLKRSGGDWVCLCPFHAEKTPSCHIYSNHIHCFGCHKHVYPVTFLMHAENLTFAEAVEKLCIRTGTEIPVGSPEEEARRRAFEYKRKRIFEINSAAADFWHGNLFSSNGQAGGLYLETRGILPETAVKWKIGFTARPGKLLSYLTDLGFTQDELITAFMAKRNAKGRFHELFFDRIIFPVVNEKGQTVGFSGRTVDPNQKDWKYFNSSDTPVYKKGETLFGINFAKTASLDGEKKFIFAEGNLDVVTMHQAGFETAVAALGTAFTQAQAKLLRRYTGETGEVVLCLDNDSAGREASAKNVSILEKCGIKTSILRIPKDSKAKDPDEFIRKYGAEGFKQIIRMTKSYSRVCLDDYKEGVDLEEPEERMVYLKKAEGLLSRIEDDSERMIYIGEVARDCRINEDTLFSRIGKLRNDGRKKREMRSFRKLNDSAVRNVSLNPKVAAESAVLVFLQEFSGDFSQEFSGLSDVILDKIRSQDFSDLTLRRVYEIFVQIMFDGDIPSLYSAAEGFTAEELSHAESAFNNAREFPFTRERIMIAVDKITKREKGLELELSLAEFIQKHAVIADK